MERKTNRSAIKSKHMPCETTYSPELSKCYHLLLKSLPQASCRSFAKASQRLSARASRDKRHGRRQGALLFLTHNPVLQPPTREETFSFLFGHDWRKQMISSHADMSAVLFPGLSSCLDSSLDKWSELLRRQEGSCLPLQAGGRYVEKSQ